MRLFSKKQDTGDDNVDLQNDHEWWAGNEDEAAPPPPPFDPEVATAVSPNPPADDNGWFMPDLDMAGSTPPTEPTDGLPPIDQIALDPLPSENPFGELTRQALDPDQPDMPAFAIPGLGASAPDPIGIVPAALGSTVAEPPAFAADTPAPPIPAAPMPDAPMMEPAPVGMPPVAPATAPAAVGSTPATGGPIGDAAGPLLQTLGLGVGATWQDVTTAHRAVVTQFDRDAADHRVREANQAFAGLRLLAVA